MRTNYNDSSGRGGRYPKRQGGGGGNNGGGGGRRQSGGGRRPPGQGSGNRSTNVAGMSSTRNKYLGMAKEALQNGNRVEAENYFQHAEHYSKMLSAAMATRREREEAQDTPENRRSNGYDRPVQEPGEDLALGDDAKQEGNGEF
jgi:hypothetical protein